MGNPILDLVFNRVTLGDFLLSYFAVKPEGIWIT